MNKQEQRRELGRQRIAQQEESGHSVRVFCREHGLSEASLYAWRKRLRKQNGRVRFALVETKQTTEAVPPIELLLAGGDRLRISHDAATLKLVLAVLRGQA